MIILGVTLNITVDVVLYCRFVVKNVRFAEILGQLISCPAICLVAVKFDVGNILILRRKRDQLDTRESRLLKYLGRVAVCGCRVADLGFRDQ